EGRMVIDFPHPNYPDYAMKSIHLPRAIEPKEFQIKAPIDNGSVDARVIQALEGSVMTKHIIETLHVENGLVLPDIENTILKTAVIERHKKTGNIGLGFTKGFSFQSGAVATTVAHDSHNILVLGTN